MYEVKCPYCGCVDSRVVESRATDDRERIRRRRECHECGKRFTTYEIVESFPVVVIKKDGSRENFDRNKLFNGMIKSCPKRPVSLEELERAVDKIEVTLQNSLDREVSSQYIGECVMSELKGIDEIAYIRFASVYRQFKDVNTFVEEVKKLLE